MANTEPKMATRQWMVTHDWMVKPMHQREWIEQRGVLIWISEVFSAIGSGLFLVSLFLNSWWGLLIGWLIIMILKLPIHIAYLGKPWRFWRLFPPFSNAWKTSWFARGVLFSVLFGMFAFVLLVIGHPFISGLIGTSIAFPIYIIFGILSGISALGIAIYGGMMMNFCKGIPMWNQGLVPIIFVLAGVADGLGLVMGIGLAGGDANVAMASVASRYLLLINIFLIISYLISANYTSNISKLSIKELLAGPEAFAFWVGLILVGLIIPGIIDIVTIIVGGEVSVLLIIAIVGHTLGAFALKYVMLKIGIYRPLLPRIGAY